MRALLQDIGHLWRTAWSFKAALLYLITLTIVVLLLPVLPLPYTPNQLDLQHVFLKPFSESAHPLGTDQLGRDVLVNLLYGARNGLLIAVPVMVLSSVIGTGIGAVAGYFGNYRITIKRSTLLAAGSCLLLTLYYSLYVPVQASQHHNPAGAIVSSVGVGVALCLLCWFGLRRLLHWSRFLRQATSLPLDSFILRVIELLTSLPRLLLLISIAAFATPSVMLLSAIFVCTYWTSTARLARAEMLRIKNLPYIEAAVSTGMSHGRIICKEALPNLTSPVIVAFIFGAAGLLAIESTLSFLGIGLPATFPSWGRTIAGIRSNLSAWWLVAFPGGFLALTVLALQTCSYHLMQLRQNRSR
ncbi:MAG TPA: ABC transporter permease [Pontibacter sp.]